MDAAERDQGRSPAWFEEAMLLIMISALSATEVDPYGIVFLELTLLKDKNTQKSYF